MGSPRHIVHILGTLKAGGVQQWILGFAGSAALSRDRHSVICVYDNRGELAPSFRRAGISSAACPFPYPPSLPIPSYRAARWIRHRLQGTFPWRLARLLSRMKADLVHTHVTTRIDLQASGVLRRARLPWVWTIHGRYRPKGAELERWRRAARLARGGRARITAVAAPLAAAFAEEGAGLPGEVEVIPGGTDLSRFRPGGQRDAALRAAWKVPPDALLFGSSGRLVPEKAYEVFIASAARLRQSGADAYFVIAGSGPLAAELEREIARHGLADRFRLVGFQRDMPAFLEQLDVFVMSSRTEGFPLSLLEAMGSGLPCLATDVGGVRQMLGESGGLIVAPESPEALAAGLSAMLSPETRADYARRSLPLADRFTYDACAARFDEIYASLLS
jgi:glycosyltransferase involved in cell wall biosynthesis